MDAETKKNLVRLYLKTVYSEHFDESWLDNMEHYEHLSSAIEYINQYFVDLEQLTQESPQFSIFISLSRKAVAFNDEIPPQSIDYDNQTLEEEINRAKVLPDTDFTVRETKTHTVRSEDELGKLRDQAYNVLLATAKTRLPNANLQTPDKLKKAIDWFEKKYEEANEDEKPGFKSTLSLLKNMDKISKLEVIDIPNMQGEITQYCTIAESAGGVTEKISVAPLDIVIKQLLNIITKDNELDFKEFKRNKGDYELRTQGILKLPKHEKTIEVQREAIALNISRILGFRTTQSTMVSYNGKAALYVPFDTIQLLGEFAQGDTQRIIVPSGIKKIGTIGDTYLHHSTIIPVGNGLHHDMMLNDFGDKVAFSFLCNDTDFVGANNQNKAIIGGKEFYIFDQVVMSSDKMEFDTRLSLVPVGVKRHSRHNQGRNRSLVEDSSFDTKFEGVLHLLDSKARINIMLDNIIEIHTDRLNEIQLKQESLDKNDHEQFNKLKNQAKELLILKNDAETIKEAVNNRLTSIFKNFPKMNEQPMTAELLLAHKNEIKPVLQLEKLMNHPVLFADDGRPYRNPWTTRNNILIKNIREEEGNLYITFDKLNKEDLVHVLRSAGITLNSCKCNNDTLIIPKDELQKINENVIFPERAPFNEETNYLDLNSIKYLSAGYATNNFNSAKKLIEHYQQKILMTDSLPEQIDLMSQTLHDIQGNSGFAKQLELRLQLDIHQKLRPMIMNLMSLEGMSEKLSQAYEAAVKLDRLNDFNEVLMQFVKNPVNTNKPALNKYLDNCIKHGALATNYNSAKSESEAMHNESHRVCEKIPLRNNNPMLELVDPLGALEEDWDEEVITVHEQQLEEKKDEVHDMHLPIEVVDDDDPYIPSIISVKN